MTVITAKDIANVNALCEHLTSGPDYGYLELPQNMRQVVFDLAHKTRKTLRAIDVEVEA